MGGHLDHEPGTQPDCPDCTEDAYEPGWYKAMLDERVLGKPRNVIQIPEAVKDEPRPPVVVRIPEEPDDSLIAVPQLADLKSVYGRDEDHAEG